MPKRDGKSKKRKKRPFFGVEIVYIGESIDLKTVQESLKQYSYLNRDHPLVLRLLDNQFAVLTKFGSVSFWNVGEKLKKQFLGELVLFTKSKKEFYPYREKTKVVLAGETDHVSFDKISIPKLSTEKIKIISYVISQSVALERYEDEIEENLREIGAIIENLKVRGKALLHEKELLKNIGKVLSVKQVAVSHLSLVDKPAEVWESEELESLYNKLHKNYEMGDRFDVLDEKINFLSDNARMLMDFIAEKRNAFLETVIIALFVIDLIPLFISLIRHFVK